MQFCRKRIAKRNIALPVERNNAREGRRCCR